MVYFLILFLTSHGFEHAQILGDIYDIGYYYVEIMVGTPPVR